MTTTLRLQVDDDTLVALQALADEFRRPLELVAGQWLVQAVRLLPRSGRAVILFGDDLDTLETILSGGSLLNGTDLRRKVERLAGVSFLHCRLPFTPNQLELLQEKASRQGLSVDQLVERTAPRIYEQFFDLVARV